MKYKELSENEAFEEAIFESDITIEENVVEGNDAWIRGEVAQIAAVLAERNLEHANAISPLVYPKDSIYLKYGKRCLDIGLSMTALILTLPINLVLAILTFRDVGSPIFFIQERTGLNLKSFRLIKFRNMTEDVDSDGQLLPPEKRITKLGLFVRSHSLDELLNFWSVLKGDMSLIGPRPLPVEFTGHMSERHKMRYAVRPGLECPCVDESVSTDGIDFSQVRFENDIRYVENVSFTTDIRLACKLVKRVFSRARNESTGTDSHFAGYDSAGQAMSLGRFKDEACFNKEILGLDTPGEDE